MFLKTKSYVLTFRSFIGRRKVTFSLKKSFHFIFFTDAFLAKPNSNCPQTLKSHELNDKPCNIRSSCKITVVNFEIFVQSLKLAIKCEENNSSLKYLVTQKLFKQIVFFTGK